MSYLEEKYSKMVDKLFRAPEEIITHLTPLKIDLWHAASGIAGEGGEVLDEVKKMCAYGRPMSEEILAKLIKEMGDVEFYMEAMRQKLGVTRGEILAANMDKLAERYPGMTFTAEAANARVDMSRLNVQGTVTGRLPISGVGEEMERSHIELNESGRLQIMQKENDES